MLEIVHTNYHWYLILFKLKWEKFIELMRNYRSNCNFKPCISMIYLLVLLNWKALPSEKLINILKYSYTNVKMFKNRDSVHLITAKGILNFIFNFYWIHIVICINDSVLIYFIIIYTTIKYAKCDWNSNKNHKINFNLFNRLIC